MRLIYHLVPRPDWEGLPPGQPYQAPSLRDEGFIHCSNADQVARVANQFYAGVPELLVLTIDADFPALPLRDEDIGTGETFPHIYGPIPPKAIRDAKPLGRGPDGRWAFHP